jgi:hypothetical protein
MSVVGLEIARREPFAGGHVFGEAGAYERIDGLLRFAVDPALAQNAVIVDLDQAPRSADGKVGFSADLCLLQPTDPKGANGTLLLEVPNRGRKGATGRFNRPAPRGQEMRGTQGIGVGDGLLMQLGWTVAWVGWQWDVIRTLTPQGLLGFDAPQAVGSDGQPIRGQVQLQWQLDAPAPDKRLSDRVHQPYTAAGLNQPDAILSEREHPGAERRVIPRERWRFARMEDGRSVPDDTHVQLDGGFQPGVLYDLVYETRVCPVVGAGMLALRDGLSFLRHGSAEGGNPCAGRIERTIGFGSSQVGRMLRGLLPLGLNTDEGGRRAMDGVLINVAGARRGEFNHRYAQPSVITLPSFGYQPPFRFEGFPADTKIVAANSSAEYWNREASLLHTDERGEQDLEAPPNVRIYHYAGTKHGAGTLRPEEEDGAAPPPNTDGPITNVVDHRPLLRAALFHLERWIADGTEPPPSSHPRISDGTAIPPEEALGWFHRLAGVRVPAPERLYRRRPLDLGPEAAHGIGRYPAIEHGEPYRWLAPTLDKDGNERAGIRLPDVSVPVATHTGWMARRPRTGGEGQNVDMQGLTIPFAPDGSARQERQDPRMSIAERYSDETAYETRARDAAATLVKDGYLLADDLELVVRNALERYRAFARRLSAD